MAQVSAMKNENEQTRRELLSALLTATRYIRAMKGYIKDERDGLRVLRAEKLLKGLEGVVSKYSRPEDILR